MGLDMFVDYMVNNGTVEGRFVEFANRVFVLGSGTERELEDYARSPLYGSPFNDSTPEIAAAIVFHKMDFENAQFDYTLRLNSTFETFLQVTDTDQDPVKIFQRQLFWGANQDYILEGFMALQNAIDTFIIDTMGERAEAAFEAATGNESTFDRESYLPYGVSMVAFPRGRYQIDDFFALIGQLLPLLYILCFLVPVSQIVAVIVLEKERRTKEQLKMMGVNETKIIASWYLTYIIYFALLAVFLTLLGPSQFPKTAEAGAPFSVIIFLTFFFQGLSVIAFCFVLSTFFTKSFNAVVGTLCIYLIVYFFYYYVTELSEPPFVWLLFPQVTFALVIETIAAFEESAQGVDFNLATVPQGGFTVSTGLGWLFFDFLLYTLIGAYLNVVVPAEFGRALPWYFPCMPSFWKSWICGDAEKTPNSAQVSLSVDDKEEAPAESVEISVELARSKLDSFTGKNNIEEVEESLRRQKQNDVGIQIRNLTKVFDTPDGKKVAVDNFNLDVYEGQILVLLGHNGAGKTTTLQMLSGMLTPTKGEVYLYGRKLSTDLALIRKSLGFCPQHDVLYPELTVRQHLRFYGKLKGLQGEELESAVIAGIENVGLTEKKDVKSRALSGGMKRKLSLAIALIGDSKVVFVDEPTSGVDPWSRRNMWEIIQNHREGRVIILTTHFMDEADLLGDRIAIMSEGKLKCCGSSLYLKQLYGAGYRLTFVKGEGCDVDGIRSMVSNYIPENNLVADVGTELSIQLPIASSAKFPSLLRSIDTAVEKDELGIEQYGISVTTLEEVFIKAGSAEDTVGNKYGVDEEAELKAMEQASGRLDIAREKKPTNVAWRHFKALFIKRFRYASRDRRACGCNTIVPLLIFAIGLIIIKIFPIGEDDPTYLLGTQDFNPGYSPNAFLPVQEFNQAGEQLNGVDAEVLQPAFIKSFEVEDLPVNPDFDVTREVFGKTYINGEPTDQECAFVATEGSQECKHEVDNNITNNAILDSALYVFNATAQETRNGASLFTTVVGQRREVVLSDSCFQLEGISATQEGFIGLNYITKSCLDSPCLLIEASFGGLTQCFPAGCLTDILSNSVLSFVGGDAISGGLALFNSGNASLFQCEGNLCNFGPAGLTDDNPCRGSPASPDPTCIADNLVLLDILNVTTDPVRVITEENLDANYCSLRNDTVDLGGPRQCQSSTALSTFELLVGLLTGQATGADAFDSDTGTCVDTSQTCEMTVLLNNNGSATCSPLSCLGNFTELVEANADPTIAPLIGPLLGLLPTESCTAPVLCTNIIDPGIVALLFANASAPAQGARRLSGFGIDRMLEIEDRRELATTNCTNTTQTCNVVELNSACVDLSCTAEAQSTLENAFGVNVGPVVFTVISVLPSRGTECDFSNCSTTFDLKDDLNFIEIGQLTQEVAALLVDQFSGVLNQTGIDPSTIDLDALFNLTDPSTIQDLVDAIDLLVPILTGPDGIDFIQLVGLLGLDPNNVLVQILIQTLQNGGNLNDPTVLLAAATSLLNSANVDVQCANPEDECVLAEFDNVPFLGTICLASGCREDFTVINSSVFGEPDLFVCNTTDCNSGCKLPSNCESEELSPVKFNATFGLVPAPELCFVETPIRYSYVGMVNNTAIHGSPILANTVNTAILRYTLNRLGASFSEANITVRSHPL